VSAFECHTCHHREVTERSSEAIPNPLSHQDAAVLIGILAVLEGELHDPANAHLASRIGDRFHREGLLDDSKATALVRQALNDMNHRVRYAAGETDEPPIGRPVP
jgi:hypothetical protein